MSTPRKTTAWINDFAVWANQYDPDVPPSPIVANDPPDIASWRREVLVPFSRAANELRRQGARVDHDEGNPMRTDFAMHVYPSPDELDEWSVSVTRTNTHRILCQVTPRCNHEDLEIFLPTSSICRDQQTTDGRCWLMALAMVLQWADECLLDNLRHHRISDAGNDGGWPG